MAATKVTIWLMCVVGIVLCDLPLGRVPNDKCEPIRVDMCNHYNYTKFPNFVNIDTQENAVDQLKQFQTLDQITCSAVINIFLCTVYFPICVERKDGSDAIQPCFDLCEDAKNGCEGLMMKFGFKWPEALACERFPTSGLCLPLKDALQSVKSKDSLLEGSKSHDYDGDGQMGPVDDMLEHRAQLPINSTHVCPSRLIVHELPEYSMRLAPWKALPHRTQKDINSVKPSTITNCGLPCDGMFFSKTQREIVRVWIMIWALVCAVSTGVTVLTFLIDTSRFIYPERPIVFLSACYFVISITYIVGFAMQEEMVCTSKVATWNHRHQQRVSQDTGQQEVAGQKEPDSMIRLISMGAKNHHAGCTVLAMLWYFFNIAANAWWVVLTIAWFLSAGLKWSHEAIEQISQYFHLGAWTLPALLTILVLATQNIDGDILSGICTVGNWNPLALLAYLIAPLCLCLLLGIIFFVTGFVSLFKIRRFIKRDGVNPVSGVEIAGLEKLMIKISIFSVFYNVPLVIIIACYFYEAISFPQWMQAWYQLSCIKDNRITPSISGGKIGVTFYGFPKADHCPEIETPANQYSVRPEFVVFMIKYLMILMVGISTSFWVWSRKTISSWSAFLRREQGHGRPKGAIPVPTNVPPMTQLSDGGMVMTTGYPNPLSPRLMQEHVMQRNNYIVNAHEYPPPNYLMSNEMEQYPLNAYGNNI